MTNNIVPIKKQQPKRPMSFEEQLAREIAAEIAADLIQPMVARVESLETDCLSALKTIEALERTVSEQRSLIAKLRE